MPEIITQHAFTIDFEDWYQGIELPLGEWKNKECRLEKGLNSILGLLKEHGTLATFFCLGWIGENYPGLIKTISDEGHEIASHGYNHEKVYNFSQKKFVEDITKTKKILEGIIGKKVVGYRAPYFSVTDKSLWAFEALESAGYTYDCSVSPVKTWRYGLPASPENIYRIKEFDIIEFPVSCFKFLHRKFGVGGAYFRIFPFFLFENFFMKKNEQNMPGMFYVHPWEFDPHHPVVSINWMAQLTHYYNLPAMREKTDKLLSKFRFTTVSDVISQLAVKSSVNEISLRDLT